MDTIKIHIITWLKSYAKEAKSKGFVIGISGGVDSAVTSTLAAETGLNILCVEMPIHQNDDQVKRAKNHIEYLKSKYPNVSSIKTDLTPTFESFINTTPTTNSPSKDLTLANTRARLRMTTLYYFAGINNYLVLGTGNKIEDFGVGFYTKYGDGGVDLSPIADLTKTEVFKLAKTLGISEEIRSAAPTDGLFGDERTDEDQIGASYPELEWAMKMTQKTTINPTSFSPREQEVFNIYTRLNTINQHKMNPIPVCIIPDEFKID